MREGRRACAGGGCSLNMPILFKPRRCPNCRLQTAPTILEQGDVRTLNLHRSTTTARYTTTAEVSHPDTPWSFRASQSLKETAGTQAVPTWGSPSMPSSRMSLMLRHPSGKPCLVSPIPVCSLNVSCW